jgi:phage shock protein A
MNDAFELAITKAAELPGPAREQLAREMLERIDNLSELRAALDIALAELDAGLGSPLDVEELISAAHAQHAE